jgi:hypothetical protein
MCGVRLATKEVDACLRIGKEAAWELGGLKGCPVA